ncbi:MAG: PAS domain-containing protein [Sphingobacteriaceae bacterium]|nr:PAS domain-containing protein [Cytophagaceae bacterium]
MTNVTSSISFDSTLLRTALDCAPGGLFLLKLERDPAGRAVDFQILLLNKAAERLVRQPEDELLGYSARQHLSALVPDHLWEKAFEANVSDEAYHELTWLTGPDDTRRLYDLTLCPHPDGVALSYQDVTELEEQKNLLEGIVTHSPNGIVVMQALRENGPDGQSGAILDFRTRFHNARAAEVLGVGTEYFQKNLFERRPETRAQMDEHQALLGAGRGIDLEFFYPPTERWLDVRSRRLDENSFFSICRDITDLKLARLEIERQNELLERVMNASLSAITVYEPVHDSAGTLIDFRVKLSNQMSLKLSGRQAAEVLGKTMTEIYPPTKTLGLWPRYAAVCESDQPDRVEHYYPHIDRWFDVAISKLGDGIVVTFNEITDQKRASQKIAEQARLFEGVLDQMQNGLTILEAVRDEAGEIVDWRYLAVAQPNLTDTGLTREEFLQNTMTTLFPSAVMTPYWSAQREVLATGVPQRFEVHYAYEGYDNYLDNSISRLDENRLISVYTVVNEQKRAIRLAEEQAARLQSVLDGTQNPVVLLEAIRHGEGVVSDFRYVTQNEAYSRLVGLPTDQLTGHTILEVLPGLHEAGIFNRYVAVIESGQPQRFEQQFTEGNVNGWFDISVVRQGDGVVVSIVDQTHLRRALGDSERLVAELRRSNADLDQFAFVASHDLSEPLRKIISFSERLQLRHADRLGDDGREYLNRMSAAAHRMQLLIDNLLNFSRLTRRAEKYRLIDLNTVLDSVQSDLELTIK